METETLRPDAALDVAEFTPSAGANYACEDGGRTGRDMRTLFFPCTLDSHQTHAGSRMIRCEWVARHWTCAKVFDGTQRLTDYDLFVFQKAYLTAQSERLIRQVADLRERGPETRLAFDLCDPDFLSNQHRERLLSVLPLFDFAVAPTEPLVSWLAQYLPAYLVPDGVDLGAVNIYRGFVDNAPPRVVWMGYRGNSPVLIEIADTMADLGITGDVVAVDKPMPFDRFVAQMAEYDILLNPRSAQPPYCYKSDNKTLVAWAAGVAVARDGEELKKLLDADYRRQHIVDGREYVVSKGNITQTVEAWRRVCEAEGL